MSRSNKRKLRGSGDLPCDLCGTVTYLEEHHLRGRLVPNPNNKDNLIDICGNCHNEIHHGDIIIEGWFATTSGRTLVSHRRGEESITGRELSCHIIGDKNEI